LTVDIVSRERHDFQLKLQCTIKLLAAGLSANSLGSSHRSTDLLAGFTEPGSVKGGRKEKGREAGQGRNGREGKGTPVLQIYRCHW